MNKLTDKLILFIILSALYISNVESPYLIAVILTSVIFSAVLSTIEDYRLIVLLFLAYTLLSFLKVDFIYFIPLICHDVFITKIKWLWSLALIPILINLNQQSIIPYSLIGAFVFSSYIIKLRAVTLENMKKDYFILRDNTKELALQLERKNKELMEKQDYEVNLATLKERNRIARDIHDNVGHMLSRSILQLGALLAISKDENTKDGLTSIKNSLGEAMNSIRSSVHDLHEESVSLEADIQNLIENFNFCSVEFNYSLDSIPEKEIKYCFIAIIKEALSNIIRHSNASKVIITIKEHPGFFQLIIHDNGSKYFCNNNDGIGLNNIKDRVAVFSGNVNINHDNGFRIFISLPKSLQ